MKKYFILMAAFAILFSCAKEEKGPEADDVVVDNQEEPTVTEGVTQFTATIPETKTYLGDPSGEAGSRSWPNYWSAGDVININGENSEALTSGDDYVGEKAATFTVSNSVAPVGGKFFALYPGSALVANSWDSSAKTASINIPSAQTWVAGSYDPAAYIMVGSSETATLSFSPMMGLIQLTTTAPASGTLYIKSIAVEPVGDEQMSGTFTTDYSAIEDTDAGPSSVTISPASGTLAFGSVFTFAIPAQNYASGVRFRITAVPNTDGTGTEQTMVFAKQSAFDVAASTLYPLTAPAFKESAITLSCTFKTSSSLGLEWSGANAANNNNFKKCWRLAIYSDEGCNTLVVQHDIPAMESFSTEDNKLTDEGVWKGMAENGNPAFIVGGLDQGTTYFCKVTDIQSGVSAVQSFTTDAFTRVSASSPSGTTLVAEDFSEVGWGPAYLGGYSGHRYAGWSPVAGASAQNAISFAVPTGVVTTGYYKPHEYAVNSVLTNFDYNTSPRLKDGWGYCWQGNEFNGYPQAGFLRMGGKNASRSFVVCPALSITDGKFATVDVTVVVTHMVNGDVSNNPDFGVFKETALTLENATQRKYTGAELNHAYPLTMSTYGYNKSTLTFRVNGVKNTDHLVLGLYKNVTNYNRFFLFSVKVERVGDEYDDEIFDITDAASLALFRSRVAGGATSLNGNVVNNVDASSIASSWTPVAGYTGTLEGNNKTISGLTQSFFNDLQGTVQNLTLNSTINETNRSTEHAAIFARTLEGGTISHCNTSGSVTYNPSEAISNGTRYIAGFVGYAKSGSISNCINGASISVPDNGIAANDAIIEAAGVVARLGDGTNSNVSCSYLTNNGPVSVAIDHTGEHDLRGSVGGVIAYVVNRKNQAPELDHLINNGTVEYSGKSGGQLMVGGVVGWTYINGSARTLSTGSYWENTSSVNVTSAARVATSKDINVGGIVGVLSCALSNSTNYGTVNNSGTFSGTAADICVGGIAGNNKGFALSNCKNENTGAITNSGSVSNSGSGSKVAIGGLVGWSGSGASYSSVCYNKGNVGNSVNGSKYIYAGGISGYAKNSSWDGCSNQGASVSNSSAADSLICVGGVVGFSLCDGGTVEMTECYNTGAISNTGKGNNTPKAYSDLFDCEASIGGVAGFLDGQHDLSGSSSSCNYNNGTVMEYSATSHVAVGGVVGVSTHGSTTLEYATNKANGDISVKDWDNDMTYVGGVLAMGYTYCTMDNTTNKGDIVFTGVTSAQVWCGGIIGQWHENSSRATTATIYHCNNSGDIKTATNGHADLAPKGTAFSYIGGICGGGLDNQPGKTYSVCSNTGEIYIYSDMRMRIGGITAIASVPPTNCEVRANITYHRNNTSVSGTGRAQIGGIVGWGDTSAFKNISGLVYEGVLTTRGSSSPGQTSGLIGTSSQSGTYVITNCSVGGQIAAAGNNPASSTNRAFLFCGGSASAGRSYRFVSCKIKSGTKLQADSWYTFSSALSDDKLNLLVPYDCTLYSGSDLPAIVDSI